ncbi:hypothetical protein [Burkholderia sp. NRF60-BP8]|uniref:hypothetical protein n=1 Tax=Burkholderia sp. NRF60-BP8 TaxID=1637853 RepID=UPI000B1FF5E3|nr:hypothetical protein [Burkholderia sp. NRF60-BP8]
MKKILIAALMWPLLTLAQSYPSPTLNNVTLLGGIGGAGTASLIGTSVAPLTTDQFRITGQLNNPTASAEYIYGAAIGAVGQPVFTGDAMRGVATQTSGSTNWTTNGIAGYVLNKQAGATSTKSAVALFGVNICAVDNCQSWGGDTIVSDSLGFTGVTSGSGRQLYGFEADCNVSSPNTKCISFFAGGTALTSSAYLVGFQTNQLGGGVGAKWTYSFASPDGNSVNAMYVGLAATGASQSSQPIVFQYTDAGSVAHSSTVTMTPTGLQTNAAAFNPQTTNVATLGTSSLVWSNIYAQNGTFSGPVTVTDPSGSNQANLTISATGDSQGAGLKFIGNGGTTPSKTIRARGGNFEFVNDAFNSVIATMTDGGSLSTNGGLNNTPVGNTVRSTGAFTTVSATSTITPSTTAGIVGTTLADNANSGSVGEFGIASTQNTSITSGVVFNATSVSLPAGDWDVWGAITTNPAGTTTTSTYQCGISTTSATFGTFATGVNNANGPVGVSAAAGTAVNTSCPLTRVNVSSPTTVYVVANVIFATSTMQVSGAIMYRRRR